MKKWANRTNLYDNRGIHNNDCIVLSTLVVMSCVITSHLPVSRHACREKRSVMMCDAILLQMKHGGYSRTQETVIQLWPPSSSCVCPRLLLAHNSSTLHHTPLNNTTSHVSCTGEVVALPTRRCAA